MTITEKSASIPYDIYYIENIKNQIEKMDKIHHIEILKILKNNKTRLNENKSGVFINMSFLTKEVINKIIQYLEYVKKQEQYINGVENIQENLKHFIQQT